jgi:hypothetical protein
VLVYRWGSDRKTQKVATFERAGVPTLARLKDGRLLAAHQYFPEDGGSDFDKVAVRFSENEGQNWTAPQVIRLEGLAPDMRFPFDPTLVPLPDGRVRLYFTSVKGRRPEEHRPAIYSAISTNGVDYEVEPGMRFGIEGRPVIDCAVVLHKGIFYLYSPDNGAGGAPPGRPGDGRREPGKPLAPGTAYAATSTDGLKFIRQTDVHIEGRRRWLGNAQSDGKTITFFGTGEPGIWSATSEDGQSWKLGESLSDITGADPGAVALKDGGYLVLATGAPRAGTPSALRRRPPIKPDDPI